MRPAQVRRDRPARAQPLALLRAAARERPPRDPRSRHGALPPARRRARARLRGAAGRAVRARPRRDRRGRRASRAVSVEKTPEAAVEVAVELLRDRAGAIVRRARAPAREDVPARLAGARDPRRPPRAGRARPRRRPLAIPTLELHLEVDKDEIFAFIEQAARRAAACRSGTSGRALVLLSGGIDSPVAAYRMMKRGLRCDFVHFSGRPFTGPESIYKAYAQAARLDRFQYDSRLFVVGFGHAQRELATAGAGRLQVLAQRRLMVRVASALARRERCRGARHRRLARPGREPDAAQPARRRAGGRAAAAAPAARDGQVGDRRGGARSSAPTTISSLPAEDCCQLFSSPVAETRGEPRQGRAGRVAGRRWPSSSSGSPTTPSSSAAPRAAGARLDGLRAARRARLARRREPLGARRLVCALGLRAASRARSATLGPRLPARRRRARPCERRPRLTLSARARSGAVAAGAAPRGRGP